MTSYSSTHNTHHVVHNFFPMPFKFHISANNHAIPVSRVIYCYCYCYCYYRHSNNNHNNNNIHLQKMPTEIRTHSTYNQCMSCTMSSDSSHRHNPVVSLSIKNWLSAVDCHNDHQCRFINMGQSPWQRTATVNCTVTVP